MKTIRKGKDLDNIIAIEFCCIDMAEAVLTCKIKTNMFISRNVLFYLDGNFIEHCPYCGAKIWTYQIIMEETK